MGILKYIFTGHPHSIKNHQKESEKFEKDLNKFMHSERTKEVLDEYNFDRDKLKDIIERNHRLGIYNVIFILNRGKILCDLLDIYTKSPQDWTEESKFIEASILLNKYNIYK